MSTAHADAVEFFHRHRPGYGFPEFEGTAEEVQLAALELEIHRANRQLVWECETAASLRMVFP